MATSLLIAVLLSVGPSLQGKIIKSIVSINEAMWLLTKKYSFWLFEFTQQSESFGLVSVRSITFFFSDKEISW